MFCWRADRVAPHKGATDRRRRDLAPQKENRRIGKISLETERTHRQGHMPKRLTPRRKSEHYPDEKFKSDIKAIRKEAEQKFLHYRSIERNQDKLRRAKSCKPNTDKHSNRASGTPPV